MRTCEVVGGLKISDKNLDRPLSDMVVWEWGLQPASASLFPTNDWRKAPLSGFPTPKMDTSR
jgi:hypothetical protein